MAGLFSIANLTEIVGIGIYPDEMFTVCLMKLFESFISVSNRGSVLI